MFTGIVSGVGRVRALAPVGAGQDMRLVIEAPWPDTAGIPIGASVACAGCCLTAVATGPDWFAVDVSGETLSRTKLGGWTAGSALNLERSLRVGDELDGHMVSGHVDGLGEVLLAEGENGSWRVRVRVPVPERAPRRPPGGRRAHRRSTSAARVVPGAAGWPRPSRRPPPRPGSADGPGQGPTCRPGSR